MPAARDTDWSHIRVVGDKDAAAQHVGYARKLLGYVKQDAAHNGLKTHQATKRLPDGTTVVAEIHGAQPIMTIVTSGVKNYLVHTLEGFYFPRRNGDTPDNTAAVLRSPRPDVDWKSYFYNDESAGYAATPEDRRGTYAKVFGGKTEEPWERLEVAGGMWTDRDTKEAVSWFRGYMGYWPMHYRHPITNYAPFVSIYGHLVYTAPDLMWRVMAAAKRDNYLYVLLAENLGALSPPARPPVASESGQVWYSQPFTDAAYTYSLWRYPLAVVTKRDTLIEAYKAAPHDAATLLWRGDLELAYGAWSFNADCTSVVTIQLPRRSIMSFRVEIEDDMWRTSTAPSDDYPEVEAKRIELAIDVEAGTASMAQTLAPLTIAEEDGVVLNLVLAERTGDAEHDNVTVYSRLEYQCGDFAVAAFDGTANVPVAERYQTSRTIYYAHLPSKTFVFLKRYLGVGLEREVSLEFEVYIEGVLVAVTDDPFKVSTVLPEDPTTVATAFAESRFNVPWAGVYDDSYEFALRVDFDAMTLLYGLSFDRRDTGGAGPLDGPNSQAFFIPSTPYVPITGRVSGGDAYTLAGVIAFGSGAGGWSVAKHGGPGPTFEWDDENVFAPAVFFNQGYYAALTPSAAPYPCGFGYIQSFEGEVVIAVKADPWGFGTEGSPYPYVDPPSFYPLRYATNGNARPLVDAIDPRLADADTIAYATYPVGHTGKPRPGQRHGMIQSHPFDLRGPQQ